MFHKSPVSSKPLWRADSHAHSHGTGQRGSLNRRWGEVEKLRASHLHTSVGKARDREGGCELRIRMQIRIKTLTAKPERLNVLAVKESEGLPLKRDKHARRSDHVGR